jgi:hypothetical protein
MQPNEEDPTPSYRELQRKAERETSGAYLPRIVQTSPATGVAFLGSGAAYRLQGQGARITRLRVAPKIRSKAARRLRHRCLKHAAEAGAWYAAKLASEKGGES